MVHVDMNKPDRDIPEGIFLVEVIKAEAKRSRKGDLMIGLTLVHAQTGEEAARDVVMLEGPGWGLGKAKLTALGLGEFRGDLDPATLVGKRVWASIEPREYDGRTYASINTKLLRYAGLQAEDEKPEGGTVLEPEEGGEDSEPTPF